MFSKGRLFSRQQVRPQIFRADRVGFGPFSVRALVVTAHRHRKAKADDQGQQGQRAGKHGVEIRALVFFERTNLSAKKVTGECGAPLRDEAIAKTANGLSIIELKQESGC
jgi:hypothetical protein